MRSYIIKQGLVAVVSAISLFIFTQKNEAAQNIIFPVWASFTYLNLLFLVVYALLSRSLKMQSQQYFMTYFGTTIAIKFIAVLGWMLYWGLIENIRSNTFILTFFALYFIFLFSMMFEIWLNTKRNNNIG